MCGDNNKNRPLTHSVAKAQQKAVKQEADSLNLEADHPFCSRFSLRRSDTFVIKKEGKNISIESNTGNRDCTELETFNTLPSFDRNYLELSEENYLFSSTR